MRIVVGVTGGIAAYKAVAVVRGFVEAGHEVRVIPTENALRFVGAPTFEAISRHPVRTSLFEAVDEVGHVALGQQADLLVIAPATADTIARLAHGIADDLLTNTALVSRAPLVIAPAMHTEMWQHPATAANVETLHSRGAVIVGPDSGRLTGSDTGPGRLAEPERIVREALAAGEATTGADGSGDLAGLRVVVSAGGTREDIDPVRFLGNRSSGRQGVALAEAAAARGASVTLVAAHLDVEPPRGARVVEVSSATELAEAMRAEQPDADVVVMAAAVADYRPVSVSATKLAKEDAGEGLRLDLVPNEDILRSLVASRPAGQVIVGFAAETVADEDELLERGRRKAARKGADLLVLNRVGGGAGFASERNTVTIVTAAGDRVGSASGTKLHVAHGVLDAIAALRPAGR